MQKCIKRKPRLTFQLSLYNNSASLRLLISSFIIKVILLLFSAVLLSIFPVDLQNYTYSSVPMCWDKFSSISSGAFGSSHIWLLIPGRMAHKSRSRSLPMLSCFFSSLQFCISEKLRSIFQLKNCY